MPPDAISCWIAISRERSKSATDSCKAVFTTVRQWRRREGESDKEERPGRGDVSATLGIAAAHLLGKDLSNKGLVVDVAIAGEKRGEEQNSVEHHKCSMRQYRPPLACVSSRPLLYSLAHLDALEQLVYLLVAQLLAQGCKDVSQLAYTDVSVALLVKDLEASNELLCRRRVGRVKEGQLLIA